MTSFGYMYLVAVALIFVVVAEPMRPKDISRIKAWVFLLATFACSVAIAAVL